jgi:Fungal specific transcription factor domain/Fungal Zn(2)-Cys(6) binuclear cluster domain
MCKQRRVRCDEGRPSCGHCTRLELDCIFRKRQVRGQRSSTLGSSDPQSHQESIDGDGDGAIARGPLTTRDRSLVGDVHFGLGRDRGGDAPPDASRELAQPPTPVFAVTGPSGNLFATTPQLPRSVSTNSFLDADLVRASTTPLRDPCEPYFGWQTQLAAEDNYDFSLGRTFDPPNGQDSLGTFTFSDIQSTATNWSQDFASNPRLQGASNENGTIQEAAPIEWPLSIHNLIESSIPQARLGPSNPNTRIEPHGIDFSPGSDYMNCQRSNFLLGYFRRITQPPASILITGVRKWRRLQRYFTKLSHQHRVVASALFAIIELLAKDDQSVSRADTIDSLNSMSPALKLHEAARKEVEVMMSKEWQKDLSARDALLASIFLLAWFEVVRDQVYDQKLFPGELAEQIITSSGSWSRYSRQLLQWFNTLDSKASHLGGQHLLSQRALQVVSEHHTQINAEDSSDERPSDDERTNGSAFTPQDQNSSPSTTASTTSPQDSATTPNTSNAPKSLRHMKTVLLNTILQPALDWYQSTQTYCRHISSHDRHHRSRFTVKDEYEVVMACKQLELSLLHLWRQRPQIIRLSSAQLREIVCADVAARLEAIFSLYMASFWVLFIYLHRVVWWHLPHSETAEHALQETWSHLQRSFGEVVESEGERKVVHPALLWPLFMFGSECEDAVKREWAVEQLLALGNASAVVGYDEEGESLPPFRLSLGATRNAKRAAVLLKKLIERQSARKCRVDDKELSMELFGCHFSII